jgi:hypothetical protein
MYAVINRLMSGLFGAVILAFPLSSSQTIFSQTTEAVTHGVEFDGDNPLAYGFSLGGAYTHLIVRNTTAQTVLLNRHKHQGNIRLVWASNARLWLRTNVFCASCSQWINTLETTTTNAQTSQVTTMPDVTPPVSTRGAFTQRRGFIVKLKRSVQ